MLYETKFLPRRKLLCYEDKLVSAVRGNIVFHCENYVK